MQEEKKVTLFMLVTNRDCMIADYAISSYKKIYAIKKEFGYKDFILFIYMNCLSPDNKKRYQSKWASYPYTTLFDNSSRIDNSAPPYPGQPIISPEGIKRTRDDYAESYDELWTTELKKFTSPFIATVDADFEVLHADFYFYLLNQLKENKSYIGASTSYSPTTYLFDTYSQRNILLHERNHTWFCIYRKEAFQTSNISHYYYEEPGDDGTVLAFDSAAYFQHDLRANHKLKFIALPDEYASSFVHYGASSKNRSLTEKKIKFYRFAFLSTSAGIIYGKDKNLFTIMINKIVRKIAGKLFHTYLKKYTIERSTYNFEGK